MGLFNKKPTEPVMFSDELNREVDALLERNDLPKAVKLVRDRTGLGLVPATQAVRARQASRN